MEATEHKVLCVSIYMSWTGTSRSTLGSLESVIWDFLSSIRWIIIGLLAEWRGGMLQIDNGLIRYSMEIGLSPQNPRDQATAVHADLCVHWRISIVLPPPIGATPCT